MILDDSKFWKAPGDNIRMDIIIIIIVVVVIIIVVINIINIIIIIIVVVNWAFFVPVWLGSFDMLSWFSHNLKNLLKFMLGWVFILNYVIWKNACISSSMSTFYRDKLFKHLTLMVDTLPLHFAHLCVNIDLLWWKEGKKQT